MATIEPARVVHIEADLVRVTTPSARVVACAVSEVVGPDNTLEARAVHVGQEVELVTSRDGHTFIRTVRPRDWTHRAELKTCAGCHGSFFFTPGERRYFESKGLAEPRRCQSCRASRRSLKLAMSTEERV